MSSDPTSESDNQESILGKHITWATSSAPDAYVLRVNPESSPKTDPAGPSPLEEMIAQIQIMNITDGRPLVYNQIGLKAKLREFRVPPTTHLVATVEDLTDELDYASEEADDMDEDIDGMSHTTSRLATSNTGKWAATSTYDVYMVDTPKDDGEDPEEEPPKRRRPRKRSKGKGRGRGSNNNTNTDGTGDGATPENAEDEGNNATPEQHHGAIGMPDDPEDPEDPEDSEDSNYLPESEDEVSLGPEDFIVPEDPLEQERVSATAYSDRPKYEKETAAASS